MIKRFFINFKKKSERDKLVLINIAQPIILFLSIIIFIISFTMTLKDVGLFGSSSDLSWYVYPLYIMWIILLIGFIIISIYRFVLIKIKYKIFLLLNLIFIIILHSNEPYNNSVLTIILYCLLILGIIYTHKIDKD